MPNAIHRMSLSVSVPHLIAGSLFLYLYLSFVTELLRFSDIERDRVTLELTKIVVVIIFVIFSLLVGKLCEYLLKRYSLMLQAVASSILVFLSTSCFVVVADIFDLLDYWWAVTTPSILLSLLYYILVANKMRLLSSGESEKNSSFSYRFDTNDFLDNSKLSAKVVTDIVDLHRRSEAFMGKARSILAIIILVLISAALFIVFAEKILALGTAQITPLIDWQREREEHMSIISGLQNEITGISSTLSNLNIRLKVTLERIKKGPPIFEGEDAEIPGFSEIDLQIDIAKQEASLNQRRDQLKYYEDRLRALDTKIDDARKEIQSVIVGGRKDGGPGALQSLTDTRLLIAAVVARLGVAVLAIYLVQMLMHLYRYNTQVAAHYRAQADALMFAEVESESIAELYEIFLPDVRYGRMPRTPAEGAAREVTGSWPFGRRHNQREGEGS